MQETMVQLHPGSLDTRSAGVSAARRCGKAEDRVQFPGGPATEAADRSGSGEWDKIDGFIQVLR